MSKRHTSTGMYPHPAGWCVGPPGYVLALSVWEGLASENPPYNNEMKLELQSNDAIVLCIHENEGNSFMIDNIKHAIGKGEVEFDGIGITSSVNNFGYLECFNAK